MCLYSSGLFPFFQFASAPNKTIFLNNIIKKHYLEIPDQELALALPAFIISILPGLEEQNETMVKNIKDILLKVRSKVAESYFFGTFWFIMLRTIRIRLVGMKYLSEVIPVYKVIEENESYENIKATFMPNLGVLVINSLISVIEDDNTLVQRTAMDFVITRLPINNKLLSDEQKISLINSGLNILVKNDYSITRRVLTWLLGNLEDEIELGDPNIKYMIDLVIASIKKIFDLRHSTKEKISNGIKIIDKLFKEQVKLVDYILEPISIDLVACVELYWRSLPHTNMADEVLIKVKKFFSYDSSYLDCLWNSLNKLLSQHLENKERNASDVEYSFKLIKFCLNHIQLEHKDKKLKYYVQIVFSLLQMATEQSENENAQFGDVKHILVLALKFIRDIQEHPVVEDKNEKNISSVGYFNDYIFTFQQYYINFIQKLIQERNIHINKSDFKLFKITTELIIRIQEYSNQDK